MVKLGAGDFIGRDALVEIKAQGVTRRLRGFQFSNRKDGVMRTGYKVYAGDDEVGFITSGSVSPHLDGLSIGMGYVDVAHCNDDRLDVEIRNRRVAASVSRKPFYKREA